MTKTQTKPNPTSAMPMAGETAPEGPQNQHGADRGANMSERTKDMSARAQTLATQAKTKMSDSMEDMQRAALDASDTANQSARDLTAQGTRFVRTNPGLAIAGAVGVGVLIGLTMRERR